MSTPTPPPMVSLGIENYVFIVLRQWRVVLAALLIGLAGGFIYLSVIPTEYTATTTVNLNVITTDPFNPQRPASGLLDDATEADVARSQVVASLAAESLSGLTASEVRRGSSVELTAETTIARVSFTSTDPDQAVAGASAVAAAYLQFRSQQAQERIGVSVASLTERIDALNARLAGVNGTIAGNPSNSPASTQATTERQQILIELEDLITDRNALQGVDTTGGSVLTPASDNDLDTAPSTLLTLATGAGLGLVLGILLAFVLNPLMPRLRGRREMTRATGRPLLASLRSSSPTIPAAPADADGLRVARERILAETRSGTARILIYDATHSGDVSAAAVDLAVVTAQSQRQCLFIAPEVSKAQYAVWQAALGVPAADDHAGRMVSATRVPGLSVFVPDYGPVPDGVVDSDLIVGRDVRAAIENAPAGSICFIAITSDAHRASLLAALREADASVAILRTKSSKSTEVNEFLQESQTLDTPLLGAIAVPRRRGRSMLVPLAASQALAELPPAPEDDEDEDMEGIDDPSRPTPTAKRPARGRSTPRRAVDAVVNSSQD